MIHTTSMNILMNQLYNNWRNLLCDVVVSNMEYINKNEGREFIERMKKVHNKIALAVLTQEKNLFAITGIQGAGKSTLVKRLYGIDTNFLPENQDRGEQLPVLITESQINEIEGYVWRLNEEPQNGNTLKSEKLSEKDFHDISREPTFDHVYMELKVPYKYFNSEMTSLVLLPGFERDVNVRSQELLEHILYLSTSSAVVFNKADYAQQDTQNMIDRVKDIYKGVKPIIVASHGDVNPEKNIDFKELLMNDFNINSSEADRVIVSGDPELFEEPWMDNLMKAIRKYGFISEASQKKQLDMLESLFLDIRKLIDELDDLVRKEEENQIINTNGIFLKDKGQMLLVTFEDMYEKYLNDLEQKVKDELEGRKKRASDNFNNYIINNKGFWNRLVSKFSVNALQEQRELEAAIKDAWNKALDASPEEVITNTVTNYINDNFLELKKYLNQPDKNQKQINGVSYTNWAMDEVAIDDNHESISKFGFGTKIDVNGNGSAKIREKRNVLERLDNFFGWEDGNKPGVLEHTELQAVGMLGILLCRQSLIAQPLLNEVIKVENMEEFNKCHSIKSSMDYNPLKKTVTDMNEFSNNVKSLESITPLVLRSIPLILGVDVAIDGKADIINNACSALSSIGITIAPAKLMGILGAGFAAAYTLNAVQKAVYNTNKYQMELSKAGRTVIDLMPELQTKAFINALRNIFKGIGDRMVVKHHQQLGAYDSYGKLELIQYNIRNIRNLNGELTKMVYLYDGFII